MRHPVPMKPESGKKVALLTAFVPGKEPYDILENTFQAMTAVEYPHDTWVLDEGDDIRVKALCKKYGVIHFSRKGIAKYNTETGHFKAKTKAGNYNAWFDAHGHEYEFAAQHDVDFAPTKDFLNKTLGYFKDPTVGFVGSPQIYGNVKESWIARAAAEQAYGFYGSIQKGLFGQDMQLFIGANHVIRIKAHDSIGGYSGHIVEDHLTGMRLYSHGWKSVYVPEILLVGEGPATWDAYFSQQTRWAYGLIDILFRHTPQLAPKMKLHHAINYTLLQQYYFFGVAQIIGLSLIFIFFSFGIESTAMSLNTLLILYPSFVIMQIIITLWMQRSYIDPKNESGFYILGKLLNIVVWPIYVLALASALVGKKLTYQVTPKGSVQSESVPSLGIFVTQLAIGSIAALSILMSFVNDRYSPLLLFWSLITLSIMYFVILYVSWEKMTILLQSISKKTFNGLPTKLTGLSLVTIMFLTFGLQVINSSVQPEETKQVANASKTLLTDNQKQEKETSVEQTSTTDSEATTTSKPVTHVVKPGESLRKIATHYFNDETKWVNIEYPGHPDLIFPGQTLIITQEGSSS